ncbi:MAG: hypothetical protein LHW41_03870 [Candidatus Cloacimonetes bacterium]|nr:hypothetical protein [Candidatus Cloacimonadota bacterium]
MKNIILIAIVFLCAISLAYSSTASEFLLGNYSYWQQKDKLEAPYILASDSVFQYMEDCGYNATICNAYHYEDALTRVMLGAMGDKGIKAILTDFGWDGLQTNDFYGTRGLSLSNYQRYEAEYHNEFDVNPDDHIDDRFYYSSCDDAGEIKGWKTLETETDTNSNGAYWECDPSVNNQEGYVYKGFQNRWATDGTKGLLEDFQFVKMAWELPDSTITHYMMDNTYLYITVAFKCPNITVNRIPYTPIDLIKLDLRRR